MDFHHLKLQSTPDNSNLLWKPKKVRVIVSSKQITGKANGWGRNAKPIGRLYFQFSFHLYFFKSCVHKFWHEIDHVNSEAKALPAQLSLSGGKPIKFILFYFSSSAVLFRKLLTFDETRQDQLSSFTFTPKTPHLQKSSLVKKVLTKSTSSVYLA